MSDQHQQRRRVARIVTVSEQEDSLFSNLSGGGSSVNNETQSSNNNNNNSNSKGAIQQKQHQEQRNEPQEQKLAPPPSTTTANVNDDIDTLTQQKQAQPPLPVPKHKKLFPALYDESAPFTEPLFSDLAEMFATQFADMLLTPVEQWGVDDDNESLLGPGGKAGLPSFRFNRRRSSIAQHSSRGTYSVLSRLAGTRDVAEVASGQAALFNDEDHKLTFGSDGTTGSGQRPGETAPPTVLISVTANPVRCVGGMLLVDGCFAFHNSPFLDKRVPPGRIRIPIPAGPHGSPSVDIVQAAKDYQHALTASSSSSPTAAASPSSTASTAAANTAAPRGASNSHNNSETPLAVLILHEYAGAASPADDWVVQTFQLVDPSSGLPAGPTVLRACKTAAAIQRRERRLQAERHGAMVATYSAAYGDGARGQNAFNAHGGIGRRASMLMEKYSLSTTGGESGGQSMRRRASRIGAGSSSPEQQQQQQQQQSGSVASGGGSQQRQLLPEEEILRLRNPRLFAWVQAQDLFELLAATTVVRKAIQQYRSSFIVRRNLRRVFTSIGVIQRFVRSLSRRRQSAMARIVRDWCALEDAFVCKLQAHRPVDGDVVEGIVAKVLLNHAVTPLEVKQKRIEEAWRASRWEIAVAWRISIAAGNLVGAGVSSASLRGDGSGEDLLKHSEETKAYGNHNNNTAASPKSESLSPQQQQKDRGNGNNNSAASTFSPEYEAWAQKHDAVNRRVFSYFMPAQPLFEAAQRRLVVQSGFGRKSVFVDPDLVTLLRRAGVSVSQMNRRRREVFLFEAQLAEHKAQQERRAERNMLLEELTAQRDQQRQMQRESSSSNVVVVNSLASTARAGGGSSVAASLGDVTAAAMNNNSNNSSTTARLTRRRSAGDMQWAALRLPPRPDEYDEGHYSAIRAVLHDETFDIYGPENAGGSPPFGSFRRAGGGGGARPQFVPAGQGPNNSNRRRRQSSTTAATTAALATAVLTQLEQRRKFGENPPPPWLLPQQINNNSNINNGGNLALPAVRGASPKNNGSSLAEESVGAFGSFRGARQHAQQLQQQQQQSFASQSFLSSQRNNKNARHHQRSDSVTRLAEQRQAVLRRGIPLPWDTKSKRQPM